MCLCRDRGSFLRSWQFYSRITRLFFCAVYIISTPFYYYSSTGLARRAECFLINNYYYQLSIVYTCDWLLEDASTVYINMNLSFLGQKWLGNIIGKLSRWGWGDLILDLFLWRFISLFVLFWPSLTKLEGIFSSSVLTFCTQPSFWMLLLSWFSQNLP